MFSSWLTVLTLVININEHMISGHFENKVDIFMRKIFKDVKISLDMEKLIALTNLKKGTCGTEKPGQKVFFSAYLQSHTDTSKFKPGRAIIFTKVDTNEGGVYNPKTGKFTAPRSGGYTLNWQYLVFPKTKVLLALQINGKFFASSLAHGAGPSYDSSSSTVIVNLKKGDTARIVYHQGAGRLHGDISQRYTGFSGFSM